MLSLGSIAHLQYYFARTGLLAGKGGQLAKVKQNGEYDIPTIDQSGQGGKSGKACNGMPESPIDTEGALMWEAVQEYGEEIMLPPTVSTYSPKEHHVAPPPDQKRLKKDLVEALENALQGLESMGSNSESNKENQEAERSGMSFHEIQGFHILDVTTLAIKAARLYYTLHPNPGVISLIKPDFQVRKDLMSVMDVLKKWAARRFVGGLREDERRSILVWISEVGMMIDQEARVEEAEKHEREGWQWIDDASWEGKRREREICFMESLLRRKPNSKKDNEALDWDESKVKMDGPSTVLHSLADGRRLVQMHNLAVKWSRRHFGQIKDWHNDIGKPYRRAENLRFWLKAAELRWEIKLSFDVMAVANLREGLDVWSSFEDAILKWATQVRKEITHDWKNEEDRKLHARAKSLAMASPANSPRKQTQLKKDAASAAAAAAES